MDRAHERLLDRNYRYQRHIYDLTREHYLLGRDHLIERLSPPCGGRVLEIGCGTARNLIAASRRYPSAHFYGIDLSRMMLEEAREKVANGRVGNRIVLAHADATAFDPTALFGFGSFDRIFLSYALSMIPQWQVALHQSARYLLPGGSIHVVDFGNGERLPALFNSGLRIWLRRFHVTPRETLVAEMRAVATLSFAGVTAENLYRGYAVHAVMARA
jgi:S-adenosylmethionine-diacylgycerolhomoserine-N-methlytransferase